MISAYTSSLDNVVEFYGKYGLPELPGLGIKQEPVVATLTLHHTFEAPGGPTVRITFEDTNVKTTGALTAISLPQSLGPGVPKMLVSSITLLWGAARGMCQIGQCCRGWQRGLLL